MNYKRITINTDVDVDLDDYFDEFMEIVTDDELLNEVEERNLHINKPINNGHIYNLRNHLCDLLDTGYLLHSDDEIIEMIKQKLKN